MKRINSFTLTFALIFTLLLTSCGTHSYSPKDLVQRYIQAVATDDESTAEDLAYTPDWDLLGGIVWGQDPITSAIRDIQKNIHNQNGEYEIQNMYEIISSEQDTVMWQRYGAGDQELSSSALDTVAVDSVSFAKVNPQAVEWLVKTKMGDHNVIFSIHSIREKDGEEGGYAIDLCRTAELYVLSELKKKWNCEFYLSPLYQSRNNHERSMWLLVEYTLRNMESFESFLKCIEENDNAEILKIFPALKKTGGFYPLANKPVIKKYYQLDEHTAHLVCSANTPSDSTRSDSTFSDSTHSDDIIFVMDEHGLIKNSRGVIPMDELCKNIMSYGEVPVERGNLMDNEYAKALVEQEEEIKNNIAEAEKDRERTARGADLNYHNFVRSSDGTSKGIEFSVTSWSNETVKYVQLTLVGYNRVGDPVWDNGYSQTVTGIGPLERGDEGTWRFDNIWTQNPSIVANYKIKSMILFFKNGGSKTIIP